MSKMARIMKLSALISVFLTLIFALLKITPLTITAATFSYHLLMRLGVGFIIDKLMHNRADYYHSWFRQHRFEKALYAFLRVSRWKAALPSYEPELFDRHQHSWDEIAQAMCQAELVHEAISVLSFLPLAASVWLGEPAVFAITSVLAAAFDMLFVILQRYNRPRILKIIERLQQRS